MKRYRDCNIKSLKKQTPEEMLKAIAEICNRKGFKAEYSSAFSNDDTLSVEVKPKDFPCSRVVLSTNAESPVVSVVNIVPKPESGYDHIEPTTYNQILDVFISDVLNEKSGKEFDVETNEEDYTIEDSIPKSFPKLQTWLSGYPLSSHPLDTNRWYDFVISLHQTDEHLSVDDLCKYLEENRNWNDADIRRIANRYESHLDLLEYYDGHH